MYLSLRRLGSVGRCHRLGIFICLTDGVRVCVADSGVGLPPEKNRIFDAFFTTKPRGTGMGLAISRTIVESLGGSLAATSNAGRGAMFYFKLPVAVEASA
jgi:signal transduction histidine kinase